MNSHFTLTYRVNPELFEAVSLIVSHHGALYSLFNIRFVKHGLKSFKAFNTIRFKYTM